jgi:hypothetical protein
LLRDRFDVDEALSNALVSKLENRLFGVVQNYFRFVFFR